VMPLSPAHEAMKNVLIAKCGTVWTSTKNGRKHLLIADQMSWFGAQLDHSLLNLSQIRMCGLSVCDDPWGECHGSGIDCEEAFVSFDLDAANITFETRVPTDDELQEPPQTCPTDNEWNPANV